MGLYDFLLVIICDSGCICHCFRDIAPQSRKPPDPSLSPAEGDPFEFHSDTYQAKSWYILLLFSENCMILVSVVLSQYTRITGRRQTDNMLCQLPNFAMQIVMFG